MTASVAAPATAIRASRAHILIWAPGSLPSNGRRGGRTSRACSPRRARRAPRWRGAAAPTKTSPVADRTSRAAKLPEHEKGGRERPSGVCPEPEPDEERGAEHHDSECHGARVGPGSDGPDRSEAGLRSRTGRPEPISPLMPHTRWVHLTRVASAAGLAAFAAYTLLAPPGGDLSPSSTRGSTTG